MQNHQADSPLYVRPDVRSADLHLLIKSMVIHDTECPFWDRVSLNNTNQTKPNLKCNPGHVVIIFTRAAVTNGARRYDSTIRPGRLAVSVSEPKRQWIGELPQRWGILQFVRQSGLNVPNAILPPKEKNNLYYNLCSQNMGQNIETLRTTQSYTSGTSTMHMYVIRPYYRRPASNRFPRKRQTLYYL